MAWGEADVNSRIKLYSFVPFDRSCRVRWLAHELGIGIDEHRLDYASGEQKNAAYLALHPFGKVPCAIIDGAPHWESGAICQLLVDAFPESELMVSRDSADYATYLSWLFFSASTFDAAAFQAFNYAALKPDPVLCFFAVGGAAKFIKDYAPAGLKGKIPLYGSGFLTEGVLDAAGPAADGIITTMHYGDSIETPRNKQFRLNYAKTFRLQPDVYAVQGYDTGLLLVQGANAVKGDLNNKPGLY